MRAVLLSLLLFLLAAAPVASAQDGFSAELRTKIDRQDELAEKGHAEQVLREARAGIRADTPEAYYLLGRALGNAALGRKQAGDERGYVETLEQAREAFWEAKELGGLLFAPAPLGLARCARIEGELAEAEKLLREALRVAPEFQAAISDLAQVMWERGSKDGAVAVLDNYARKHPSDVEIRLVLARMRAAREDWERAEADFRIVLDAQPANLGARKLLALALFHQEKFEGAAREFETAQRTAPKDAEIYQFLFATYAKLKRLDDAKRVMNTLIRELPASEDATRARDTLAEMEKDPEYATRVDDRPKPEQLVRRLEVAGDDVRERALHTMREFEWSALPAQVYKLLSPAEAGPGVRRAAVMLIGEHGDPATVPLLEILLFHPRERETEVTVRRAAAEAIGRIGTPAVVPFMYRLLDSPDREVREAAIQGIAARTGKYFRPDLTKPSDDAAWPAERDQYRKWWASAFGSLARLDACKAMKTLFSHLEKGRSRLAVYSLEALDDADARTFQVGYELFRALSGQSFGYETGEVAYEQRRQVAQQARSWVISQSQRDD